MALGRTTKTEHAGAKNGGGFYGKRLDAKQVSRKLRRRDDRRTSCKVCRQPVPRLTF